MIGQLNFFGKGVSEAAISQTVADFRRKFPDQQVSGIRLNPKDIGEIGTAVEGVPVVTSQLTPKKHVYVFCT